MGKNIEVCGREGRIVAKFDILLGDEKYHEKAQLG
jgi:hypothetical protein